MLTLHEIYIKARTEPVYLLNTFEDIALRMESGDKYFAKPKGLDEYPIAYNTDLVVETLFEKNEITKEEYDNY